MGTTRVLLVDDHELVRASVAAKLGDEPDLEIIDTVEDADTALTRAVELQPDVIVMDIDMPGLIPFDAARRIQSRCPNTRILFLSAHTTDNYIEQALAAHACGYVTKGDPFEILISAVREVAAGGAYFSDGVRRRLIVDTDGVRLNTGSTRGSRLTPRETEVLLYLARGDSKKEIARTMSLSTKTIENHTSNLMNKLDIHDRVELARYAIKEGLVEL